MTQLLQKSLCVTVSAALVTEYNADNFSTLRDYLPPYSHSVFIRIQQPVIHLK